MSKDAILRRLVALRSDHLPKLVLDFIAHDLGTVSAAEIERRLTRDYVVTATRRAIEAMRARPKPHVAAQMELPFGAERTS